MFPQTHLPPQQTPGIREMTLLKPKIQPHGLGEMKIPRTPQVIPDPQSILGIMILIRGIMVHIPEIRIDIESKIIARITEAKVTLQIIQIDLDQTLVSIELLLDSILKIRTPGMPAEIKLLSTIGEATSLEGNIFALVTVKPPIGMNLQETLDSLVGTTSPTNTMPEIVRC